MISAFTTYAAVRDWGSCVTPEGVATLKCLDRVFENLLTMASALAILVLFIMFIIGSIKYITSGGDPEKIKSAKDTYKYALVGLVLFVFSFLILKTIDVLFLGGKNRLFDFTIPDETGATPTP